MQSESLAVKLKLTLERDLARAVLLALAAGLSITGYLIASSRLVGIGFPLDDAWIHQTYARNLGQTGQWTFVSGQPSAGSTAPLWTLVAAAGYALHLDGIAWIYAVGIILLAVSALLAGELTAVLFPSSGLVPLFVALFCAVEWHLGWAAVSGMETLLFIALELAVLLLVCRPQLPRGGGGWGWGVLGL